MQKMALVLCGAIVSAAFQAQAMDAPNSQKNSAPASHIVPINQFTVPNTKPKWVLSQFPSESMIQYAEVCFSGSLKILSGETVNGMRLRKNLSIKSSMTTQQIREALAKAFGVREEDIDVVSGTTDKSKIPGFMSKQNTDEKFNKARQAFAEWAQAFKEAVRKHQPTPPFPEIENF